MRVIYVDSRAPECVGTSTKFTLQLANSLDTEKYRKLRVDTFRLKNVPTGVDTIYLGCGLVTSMEIHGGYGQHDVILSVPVSVAAGQTQFGDSPWSIWFDLPLTLQQTLDFTIRDDAGTVIPASEVNYVTFTVSLQ